MPRLTIVIGGNGAGKTTWGRGHRDELPDSFYNADAIAEGLGGWNSRAAQEAARTIVTERIRDHLNEREDFGFESTYSGKSTPAIVVEAKRLGYQTRAVLIGTQSPAINIERVAVRVAAGTGHQVPVNEVKRRWTASKENLVRTAPAMDVIDLVDTTGPQTRPIERIEKRQASAAARPTPKWAAKLRERIAAARDRT